MNFLLVLTTIIFSKILSFLTEAKLPEDLKPINVYNDPSSYSVFDGSFSVMYGISHNTRLRYLQGIKKIGRNLYVYGRENIFVVDLDGRPVPGSLIPFIQVIDWAANKNEISLCMRKGRNANECKNFIKVFLQDFNNADTSRNEIIICGTNAFQPSCRIYKISEHGKLNNTGKSLKTDEFMCSSSPRYNSPSILVGNSLYTATVRSHESLVVKSQRNPSEIQLATTRSDYTVLNDPRFFRFIDGGYPLNKIFLFFTEKAVEGEDSATYTRVAQVCKNDRGGNNNILRGQFSSFFKTRLNCSFPGQPPFYFNVMRDVTDLVSLGSWYGLGNQRMVFALMNTPQNSIPASAICAFTLSDINSALSGPFLEKIPGKYGDRFFWEKLQNKRKLHPSSCEVDAFTLNDEQLNFAKKHPLMYESVPSWNFPNFNNDRPNPFPLFIQTNRRSFLTSLFVDTEAGIAFNYTVLFVGTEDGKIHKILLLNHGETLLLEERMVYASAFCTNSSRKVKEITIDKERGVMMVAFETCVVRAPLCPLIHSPCRICIDSQDPFCGWNGSACVYAKNNHNHVLQNVTHGLLGSTIECPVTNDRNFLSVTTSSHLTSDLINNVLINDEVNDILEPTSEKTQIAGGWMEYGLYAAALVIVLMLLIIIIICKVYLRKSTVHKLESKMTNHSSESSKSTSLMTKSENSVKTKERVQSDLPIRTRLRTLSDESQLNNDSTRKQIMRSSSHEEHRSNRKINEASDTSRRDDGIFSFCSAGEEINFTETFSDSETPPQVQRQSSDSSVKKKKGNLNSSSNHNESSPLIQNKNINSDLSNQRRKKVQEDKHKFSICSGSGFSENDKKLAPRALLHSKPNGLNRSVSAAPTDNTLSNFSPAPPYAAGFTKHPPRGVTRHLSYFQKSSNRNVNAPYPQGFYNPQPYNKIVPAFNRREEKLKSNLNSEIITDGTQSLGRREIRPKPPYSSDYLIEQGQTNGAIGRRRQLSESGKSAAEHILPSLARDAIEEESGPESAVFMEKPSRSQRLRMNLKLDLVQKPMVPKKNPGQRSFSTHSNPGTPSKAYPLHHFDHGFQPLQNHSVINSQSLIPSEQPHNGSPLTSVSSGYPFPAILPSLSDHERTRYPSGQSNTFNQSPSSPFPQSSLVFYPSTTDPQFPSTPKNCHPSEGSRIPYAPVTTPSFNKMKNGRAMVSNPTTERAEKLI